jgi:UDP-N-acetylglucosamine:LPS N-acetylglucosamine transferase
VSDVRKGLGLGTDTPYIAYVCGARTVHYDIEDVLNLKKVLSKSKYSNVHIVLRPHPQALKTEYQKLINLGIIVDFNLDVLSGDPAVFDRKSMEYMAAFLSGAQFVISSWGTTALLEACIFQRPSIQLRWMDSVVHTNTSEVLMVKNFQRYIHMRAFDEEGARLYSDSPETLIATMEKLESMEDHFNQKRFNAVKRIVKTPLGDVLNRVIEVVEAVGNQRFIKQ